MYGQKNLPETWKPKTNNQPDLFMSILKLSVIFDVCRYQPSGAFAKIRLDYALFLTLKEPIQFISKTVTIRYTIPGTVTRWADGPARIKPAAGERLAFKEFTIRIEKKYPPQAGDKGFTPQEDCNIQNTTAFKTISYMEKI